VMADGVANKYLAAPLGWDQLDRLFQVPAPVKWPASSPVRGRVGWAKARNAPCPRGVSWWWARFALPTLRLPAVCGNGGHVMIWSQP